MNYDDLLWKCKDVLSEKDFMRLAGLVASYNDQRRRVIEDIKNKQVSEHSEKYSDTISDGGMDPRL